MTKMHLMINFDLNLFYLCIYIKTIITFIQRLSFLYINIQIIVRNTIAPQEVFKLSEFETIDGFRYFDCVSKNSLVFLSKKGLSGKSLCCTLGIECTSLLSRSR